MSISRDVEREFERLLYGDVRTSEPDPDMLACQAHSAASLLGLITATPNFSLDSLGQKVIEQWSAQLQADAVSALVPKLALWQTEPVSQDQFLGAVCAALGSEPLGQHIWQLGDAEAVSDRWSIPSDLLKYLVAVHIKSVAAAQGLIRVDPARNEVTLV